ncbi:helix-turn-helix domain-containing protein [Sphingobium aquiterrae]|uniref:TetR/AcrR family transcriptional regulator n=1 Tax=Sphingobium aquiterrae TaxID=2038656 RepID=UPI003019BE9F
MTVSNFLDQWRQLPALQRDRRSADPLGKQERTRRRLLGFAMQLFAEKGYEPTTAADIAAAAGVSRATFFAHFPTKAALLGEISRTLAEQWALEPAPADEQLGERLLRFVTFLFRESESNAITNALLADFVTTYGDDMGAGSGLGSVHHCTEQMIRDLQDGGLWTRAWSAEMLAHFLLITFNRVRPELEHLSPKDAAIAMMDLLSLGVSIERTQRAVSPPSE